MANLHSKIVGAHHPRGLIFLIFMQFVGKFGQIISWYPFWEIRNLPHSGDNLNETRSADRHTNKLTRNQNIVILVLQVGVNRLRKSMMPIGSGDTCIP